METGIIWIAASSWQDLAIAGSTALTGVTPQLPPEITGGLSAVPFKMLALGVVFLLVARYGRKGV